MSRRIWIIEHLSVLLVIFYEIPRYLVKSYQVCDSQDFLSVKYEPYNVPTSKDIKIGAGVELVLTGMLPPCSKTYAQCFHSFHCFS